ncbi:caspase domain-containing protein, partial [Candidatus Latescibacterota bacterium]
MKNLFITFLMIFLVSPYSANAQPDSRGLKRIMESQAGKRWAICIGINNYVDRKINHLNKAANDAYGLAEILENQGDFKAAVFSDLDAGGNEQSYSSTFFPTKRQIENYLDAIMEFKDIKPNDLVVFSFSGHGISDDKGNGYLLPVDWNSGDPYGSAIPVSVITSWLQKLGVSKSLMLVDACREEMSTSRSMDTISRLYEQKFDSAHVSAVFYATRQGGFSYEDPDSDYGAFTRFLIESLDGQGDKDQDGLVTFRELSTYVEDSLGDWALNNGYMQRPYTRILGEQSGDLALTVAVS